jgi:hypothetical protein
MYMSKNDSRIAGSLALLIPLAVIVVFYACSDKKDPTSGSRTPQEGFTFFELGAGSLYSADIRQELKQKLGSDAISSKTTIDLSLSTDHSDLWRRAFPPLVDLNQRLNWPPRERVEHDTLKLMYRYTKNLPFSRIELLFSGISRKPLLFRINAKADGASMVESVTQKHGAPQEVASEKGSDRILYWQDGSDFFLIHVTKDIHDQIRYEFMIYFVDNMEDLLKTELKAGQRSQKERKDAGRQVF